MKYPHGVKSKKTNHATIHSHRGMQLEADLNLTNQYYLEHNIAIIHKKPTPINATKVHYQDGSKKIADGYFSRASTTDYNGIYQGKYIDFEAKSTNNATSFPLSNIHEHQLKHLKQVQNHGGISFIIIAFSKLNRIFLLETAKIFDIIEDRKSIPFSYIEKYGYEIKQGLRPRIDYLKVVDLIIGGK